LDKTKFDPSPAEDANWMRFEFILSGHGWADAEVSDELAHVSIEASYISDCLDDLLYAVWRTTQGDVETRCSCQDEPGEHRWIINRDGQEVLLRVLRFESSHPRRPDELGRLIYQTRQDVTVFARAIALGASRTLETYGEMGFELRWGKPFPTRTLELIQAELRR
jgi:hypothetical protein